MPYATTTDLEARLTAETLTLLADDDGDGAPDASVLAAALADAAAEIDRALAGRYVTPVDAPPAILTRWCADLAVENLYLRRRETLPRESADRAQLARRALDAVESGLAGLAGAQPIAAALAAENLRRGDDPTFDLDKLAPY